MSFQSFMMRIMCTINDRKRDKGLQIPKNLMVTSDVSYGPNKLNMLDIYRPEVNAIKLPVIVSVHGGGWVYGSKEVYKHYCMDLAKRGFIVVNYNYRLSPKDKFPCHLEDTVMLFDWLVSHTGRFGMDEKNIFAVGDSAGAHILSLYCAFCTNPEYAARYPFQSKSNFLPKGVALNCGIYDMKGIRKGAGNTKALMRDVLSKGGTDEELEWVSPIRYMNENFPPSYIITAYADFLKEQAKPMADKLESLGVPCIYKLYGDEANQRGHVFHLNVRDEIGRLCNEKECEFFKQLMEKTIE